MDDLMFEQLLNTYGADLSRWPAHLRASAQQCLAGSSRAQASMRQAQQLDALIGSARAQVSEARAQHMISRVLHATATAPQPRSRWPLWLPALLFTAAAAAGCATGLRKPEWIGLNSQPQPVSVVDAALNLDAAF
jgi:hypothetical protein